MDICEKVYLYCLTIFHPNPTRDEDGDSSAHCNLIHCPREILDKQFPS